MAENKKHRKSTRKFNLEKPVERQFDVEKHEKRQFDVEKTAKRHFDIEKGSDNDSTPNVNSVDNQPQVQQPENSDKTGGGRKLGAIIVVVVVAVVAAFVALRGCNSSDENATPTTPNTEFADSTQAEKPDTASNAADSVANTEAGQPQPAADNVAPSAEPVAASTGEAAAPAVESRTSAPEANASSIEEKAKQVWRGDYGVGAERKAKLGSEYNAVQRRVNEMYRSWNRR